MTSLPFSKLTEIYEQLEVITSGNKMREILSNFFKKVPKQDIDKVTYLTLGKIDADFKHIELGLAEKMILRAIAAAAEKDIAKIKPIFKKTEIMDNKYLVFHRAVGLYYISYLLYCHCSW